MGVTNVGSHSNNRFEREQTNISTSRTTKGPELQEGVHHQERLDSGSNPTIHSTVPNRIRWRIGGVVKEGRNMGILKFIRENRYRNGYLNLKNPNADFYRIVVVGGNIKAIRLAGGGNATADYHGEIIGDGPMSEEFLVGRDEFRQWYCEYVVKYKPSSGDTLEDIQQFQIEFDKRKDQVEAQVAFNLEYALGRMTDKLGELASSLKEMRHAEASGMHDKALSWKNSLNSEIADLFIYTVKIANEQGQRLDGLYHTRMRENLAQLETGNDEARGTNSRSEQGATTTTMVTRQSKSITQEPSRN
jgi:hypothetical protein